MTVENNRTGPPNGGPTDPNVDSRGGTLRRRVSVGIGIGVAGTAQLVLAYVTSGFPQDLLINTGASTLLFVPLWALQGVLERKVDRAQRVTDESVKELRGEVEAVGSELRQGLDSLREEFGHELRARDADHEAAVRHVTDSPTADGLSDALSRAMEERVVSSLGVRVRIIDSRVSVYGRFRPTAEGVSMRIERRDGEVLDLVAWAPSESAVAFMLRVADELRKRSLLPEQSFDPGFAFQQLRQLLETARQSKRRFALVEDLSGAVEHCPPQWMIYDWGIGGWSDDMLQPYYVLPSDFGDPRQVTHMAEKGWVDLDSFREAFETAEALHGRGRLVAPEGS